MSVKGGSTVYMKLDHAIFLAAGATSDTVWPLPLYSGRSPHYCGRSPHYCCRSMSESDCVRSMFRSGVYLWATIQTS